MTRIPLQRTRAWSQIGFFSLFLLAPPLDLLRIDLTQGHAILLGQDWTLGIDAFLAGRAGPGDAALNLLLRGFLPILSVAALFMLVAWRYGRLYCGWLCPHFSVVELINGLMRRACGRPSLWERRHAGHRYCVPSMSRIAGGHRRDSAGVCGSNALAAIGTALWKTLLRAGDSREEGGRAASGTAAEGGAPVASQVQPNPWYWIPTLLAVVGFAFLWAVAFLTYLLPPFEVYHNLLHGTLTRNQGIFLTTAALALCVEFLLARHFFCRYACAVGLFQSLAWMANDRAMVVGFDTRRAAACSGCDNVCDHACPMRLKPRTIKRRMFTCTECGECIAACTQVQGGDPQQSLLRWVAGDAALPVVTGRPIPSPASAPVPVSAPDPAEPGRRFGV